METKKLIPLLTAYKKCMQVEKTQQLKADVDAGKIKTVNFNGFLFVDEVEVAAYFPPQVDPTPDEVKDFIEGVKSNSEFFQIK